MGKLGQGDKHETEKGIIYFGSSGNGSVGCWGCVFYFGLK